MKRNLILLPLLLLLSLSPGCKTVSNETVINDIAAIANVATFTGVSIDLRNNPTHLAYYRAAREALTTLIESGNVSPSQLAAALQQLPIKELSGDDGTLIIGAAVTLYTRAMTRVDIDQSLLAKEIAVAVRDGINQVVGNR